eukprot:3324622-Amphidinium_carterae.1
MTKEISDISDRGRRQMESLQRALRQRSSLRSATEKPQHVIEMKKMQHEIDVLMSQRQALTKQLTRAGAF